MRYGKLVAAFALTAGLGFTIPAAAAAQQQVPEQQETVEVTDELLERFVAVYPAVVNVAQATQNQLASAETAEEAQAIQAEIREPESAPLAARADSVRVAARAVREDVPIAEQEPRLRTFFRHAGVVLLELAGLQ